VVHETEYQNPVAADGRPLIDMSGSIETDMGNILHGPRKVRPWGIAGLWGPRLVYPQGLACRLIGFLHLRKPY